MADPYPPTGHWPVHADAGTLHETVGILRRELSAVDFALGDHHDQVLWPDGLSRAEAIQRLIQAVRMAESRGLGPGQVANP